MTCRVSLYLCRYYALQGYLEYSEAHISTTDRLKLIDNLIGDDGFEKIKAAIAEDAEGNGNALEQILSKDKSFDESFWLSMFWMAGADEMGERKDQAKRLIERVGKGVKLLRSACLLSHRS